MRQRTRRIRILKSTLDDPGLDILPNLKSSQGTNQSSSFSSRVSAATPPHHLDSTGYLPSLEFVNLNETTIARAGDPLALDFKLNGIGPTAISKWKFLSIMLIVNGSDLFWYSTIPKQVAVGYTATMVVDLPRGRHQLQMSLYYGKRVLGLNSSSYLVEMVQLRKFLPNLRQSTREGTEGSWRRGQDPSPLLDVEMCQTNLMCRVLQQFDKTMSAFERRCFITYYTLLGAELWGWFLPWRGDHRWDRGAANGHTRFLMHRTPWKDTIHVGMLARDWDASLVKRMNEIPAYGRLKTMTKMWTVVERGNKTKTSSVSCKHFLGVTVEILLFHEDEDGYRRSSTLDSSFQDVKHDKFELVERNLLGGTFLVPKDVKAHLLREMGLGYEEMYSPRKDDPPHEEPDRLLPRRDQDSVSEELSVVLKGCQELRGGGGGGGAGAAFEVPRMPGDEVSKQSINDYFSVLLCPAGNPIDLGEGGGAGGAGGAGGNSTDLVFLEAALEGAVVVKRKLGCEWNSQTFMGHENKKIEQFVRRRFGPDEITVELEGPELLFLHQEHLGNCMYRFKYQVSIDGFYSLRVRVLRQNYRSVDELRVYRPEIYFDDPLGSGFWLAFAGTKVKDVTGVELLLDGRDLPSCSKNGSDMADGRWISMQGDASKLFLSTPYIACPKAVKGVRNPSFRAGGSGRRWLVDPSQFYWVPYKCREQFFGMKEADACLARRRILFSGDSHMRVHYNSVMKFACGIPEAAQKGHHTSQCHLPRLADKCSLSLLCLEHNMVGWMDATVDFSSWDLIVSNFGQHSAAGAEHWTVAEYGRHVEVYLKAIARRMREARGSRARFLWMATPAMVHVRDNMISECMDWRTNQRLALYEEQAKTLVQRYQQEFGIERFMYMDTYNLTLPMIEAAKGDCGHFLPANIQLAAVQQFLNLAC